MVKPDAARTAKIVVAITTTTTTLPSARTPGMLCAVERTSAAVRPSSFYRASLPELPLRFQHLATNARVTPLGILNVIPRPRSARTLVTSCAVEKISAAVRPYYLHRTEPLS